MKIEWSVFKMSDPYHNYRWRREDVACKYLTLCPECGCPALELEAKLGDRVVFLGTRCVWCDWKEKRPIPEAVGRA